MAFNLVRYEYDAHTPAGSWGVVGGDRVLAVPGNYETTAELLSRGLEAARAAAPRVQTETNTLPLAELRILSPVTHPCRIVAQGVNYRSHRRESGLDPERRAFNVLFRKSSAAITGPFDPIVRPPHVELLDYEVELGIVVGRRIDRPTTIQASDLARYVGALVVANDVSARDVQLPQSQFYKGKSYRTFCPVGPYLCIPDPEDLQRLAELRLTLRVNGKVRQDQACSDMVYTPAETLTEISEIEDLDVGDLLLTGTPGGCALQAPPAFVQRLTALLPEERRWKLFFASQRRRRTYLQPGDRVTATIRTPDGVIDLGVQENTVR